MEGWCGLCKCKRALRDWRAIHWQEASRGSGFGSICPGWMLGCDFSWAVPGEGGRVRRKRLGPGEGAAGLGWGGWLPALLLGPDCCMATSPVLCGILTKPHRARERRFSSLLAGLGFCLLLPCFCLFSQGEQLLSCSLSISASPRAARGCFALVLPDPKLNLSTATCIWHPLPWSCLCSTPPSPCFV